MSGIGAVMDIAIGALASASYGIDVTGHNIANVSTEGYSRQAPVQEAKRPMQYRGLQMGRGVSTTQVTRETEQMLEDRLMQQKGSLARSTEMEKYAKILETVFTENASASVSSQLNEYWNLWHDVTNNPSGAAERIALNESSSMLAEQFQSLDRGLKQLATDITNSLIPEIDKINQLSQEIAYLNNQIVGLETGGVANDLRDKRNTLVARLAESIDLNSFEQDNGSLTVVSAKGSVLVHGDGAYGIALGGINGDRVEWQNSGGTAIDITNHISTGKLGGWLEMRDEVLAKYQLDLDGLVKEFVWTTNQQHSQGVGLDGFSSLTSDYKTVGPGIAIGSAASGLTFHDRIQDGSFQLWVYGGPAGPAGTPINIVAGTTLDDVRAQIEGAHAEIASTVVDGQLQITASNGYTFAFSNDTSHTLAALGINNFFEGSNAGSIAVSDNIGPELDRIAAGRIDVNGVFSSGDNTNAISITDLQFARTAISQWTCDRLNGNTEGTLTVTIDEGYHAMAGSIGAVSAGISMRKAFAMEMVNNMSQMRDSISAVSLDEEMTNLIKFQHAYSAAAKLISTADEMLATILALK